MKRTIFHHYKNMMDTLLGLMLRYLSTVVFAYIRFLWGHSVWGWSFLGI